MCELVFWSDNDGDTLWFWLAYGCEHLRDELGSWLRSHGIDPDTVTNPGILDRDITGRAVTVTADDGHGFMVTRRYQGETPPLEFPDAVHGYGLTKWGIGRRPPLHLLDGYPIPLPADPGDPF